MNRPYDRWVQWLLQSFDERLDARCRGLVLAVEVARVVDCDMADDLELVQDVVEDDDVVEPPKRCIRQAQAVRVWRWQALETSSNLIAEEADEAAVEARQARHSGDLPREMWLHQPQRVRWWAGMMEEVAVAPLGVAALGREVEDQSRLRAEEGVARDLLAPLDALQQEGGRRAG